MDKLHIFAIAIGVLILVGLLYSRMGYPTTTTTPTTKTVAVRQPVVVVPPPRYGYVPPPPPRYNAYKNQYYY
jgi:hypothetical protein